MFTQEMERLHRTAAALRRKAEKLKKAAPDESEKNYTNTVVFHLDELITLADWIDHHADKIERS